MNMLRFGIQALRGLLLGLSVVLELWKSTKDLPNRLARTR